MLGRLVSAIVGVALLASPAAAQRIGVGVGIGGGGAGGAGGSSSSPTLSSLSGSATTDAAIGTIVASPSSTLAGCSWSIASQSNFAQASSTGKVTKAAASVTAGSYTPSASCTLTSNGQTVTVAAPLSLTMIAPPASTTSTLLMGSRYNQMGFNGYTGSDGTDTDSNFRLSSFNETGATVTKARAYFANWFANATNEQDGYNAITVKAAIEYPEGTYTPLTFTGGASSITMAASGTGSLAESDEATLATPVPAGAQYWVRTFVTVAAGGRWPQGYLRSSTAGEAIDFTTGVDKTTSGGIFTSAASATTRRGYGPVAVTATGFTGTPTGKAFAAVGDSIIMGSGDAADPIAVGHGNFGYFAKAAAGYYPVVNLGIAGTKGYQNVPASFTRRGALLTKLGPAITHIFSDWSINDIDAGRQGSTLASSVATLAAGFKSYIPTAKVIWATLTPYTSTSDSWKTTAGQTPRASPAGAYTGGSASQRSQFNALLRAGISGVDYVFDAADVAETVRDSGIWRAGEGSTHLTNNGAVSDAFTTDGLHPAVTNTAGSGSGGVYVLRDAVRAQFPNW